MKKLLIIFLASFILFGCTKETPDQILMDAMNSKIDFINEENKGVLFKEFPIYEDDLAVPDKYAYVDMDNDGTNELVVETTSYYGAFIILHYDKETRKIYGYMLGARSLEDLKEDGTFIGSGGAAVNSYCKIKFDKNKYEIIDLAYSDSTNNEYKIDDKDVTKKEIEEFTDNWFKKTSVEWIEVE